MSQHLSSQQILDWMNGDYSPEADRHVRECADCAAQVESLTHTLAMFRSSVREASAGLIEQRAEQQVVLRMPQRRVAWRWLPVAAALVVLAAMPVYKLQQQQARQKAAEVARQDAELMEQVDAELSEEVASPMKPLEQETRKF